MNPPPATRRRIIKDSEDFAKGFKDVLKTMKITIPLELGMVIHGYIHHERMEPCSMAACPIHLYLEECVWWMGHAYCKECYRYLEEHNFFSFSDREEDEDEDEDLVME